MKRLVSVTRLVVRKGIHHLLEAMAAAGLDWEVRIAGEGAMRPELERMAERLGVPCQFLGWVDRGTPEYERLLRDAGLFALPSLVDNFPVTLLDAMCAGLPTITTRGTGCREVVGEAGVLVDPGNVEELAAALSRLAGDLELRQQLGQAGWRRARDMFSWPAIGATFEELWAPAAAPSS